MPQFTQLWEHGPFFAQADHFRMGTDCVLLSNFISLTGVSKGIDLGCASGAILLLLLARKSTLDMTGLELLPKAVEIANQNLEVNSYTSRSRILQGDIRLSRNLFASGSFDLVVSNPPYFPAGSGKLSPDTSRAASRTEVTCSLEDICRAASYLCRSGGTFALVHKPERLSEAMVCMTRYGLEPKRLRMVCHKNGSAPNLVLLEGKRGGKPGLRIEPQLVIRNEDDSETDEIRSIYHRT